MPGRVRVGLPALTSGTMHWLAAAADTLLQVAFARELCAREDRRNARGEPCPASEPNGPALLLAAYQTTGASVSQSETSAFAAAGWSSRSSRRGRHSAGRRRVRRAGPAIDRHTATWRSRHPHLLRKPR